MTKKGDSGDSGDSGDEPEGSVGVSSSLRVEGAKFDRKLRRGFKRRVLYLVGLPAVLFAYVLLPGGVLEMLLASAEKGWKTLAHLGGGVTGSVLLAFVFYAQNPLRHGEHPVGRFFRSQYPTEGVAARLKCTEGEIAAAWFDFFHLLAHPNSGLQDRVRDNYETTYSALAIYYLQRLLPAFALLGAVAIVANHVFFDSYSAERGKELFAVHVILVAIFIIVGWWLNRANRLPSAERGATGCWRRITQEFDMQRAKWNEVIGSKAQDIRDVRKSIDGWEKRLAKKAG